MLLQQLNFGIAVVFLKCCNVHVVEFGYGLVLIVAIGWGHRSVGCGHGLVGWVMGRWGVVTGRWGGVTGRWGVGQIYVCIL